MKNNDTKNNTENSATKNTVEIKPCPFCGGKANMRRTTLGYKSNDTWTDAWMIKCNKCGASSSDTVYVSEITRDKDGNILILADGYANAVNAWNTRYVSWEEK